MSSVVQLRNQLIDRLLTVRDHSLLNKMLELLESNTSADDVVKLSEVQKLAILQSEEDAANGRITPNDEVTREDLKWLDENQ